MQYTYFPVQLLDFRATIEYHEGRPGDVLRLCADMTKARLTTGFETRVTLREGLTQLLAWYRAKGVSPEKLLENEVPRNWVRST